MIMKLLFKENLRYQIYSIQVLLFFFLGRKVLS
jgi:hypothetical protein